MKLSNGINIYKALYIVVLSFLLLLLYGFVVHFFAAKDVVVACQKSLSQELANSIADYIKKNELHRLSVRAIEKELTSAFDAIEGVTCLYNPLGVLELGVHTTALCCQLNDHCLVTTGNKIVAKTDYSTDCFIALPHVKVNIANTAQALPDELFHYMQQLDPLLCAGSIIEWNNEHEINFLFTRNCEGERLCIITDTACVPNKELLNRCISIMQELSMQSKPKRDMVFDVRFAHQIIVSGVKQLKG